MPRRSSPWAIDERQAPSPSPYIRETRAWWAGVRSRLPEIPTGDEVPSAGDVRVLLSRIAGVLVMARPPSPRETRAIATVAGRVAVRGELRGLARIGMPLDVLQRLTGEEVEQRTDDRRTGSRQPRVIVRGSRQRRRRVTTEEVDAAADRLVVPTVDIRRGGVLQRELDAWALEGARYVSRIPAETTARLAARVAPLVAEGARWETIATEIANVMDASASRLELIARDQTAKLNSRITETLQQRAGIEEYIWRATPDARTRAVHRQANGNRVSWASQGWPNAGFYGQPAHAGRGGQCRCTAEPVPPDDWLD